MNFITFLQNTNNNILSAILNLLNLVLFVQLAIGCCRGIRRGWTIGEATTCKITELGLYTAMFFCAWQWWPHKLVLLTIPHSADRTQRTGTFHELRVLKNFLT